jgi:glycosyltransferase involved in cell wall biosynthesis
MKVDFCIPIYNEKKILEKSVNFLSLYLDKLKLPYDWQIVIIDNGSKDGSGELSKKLENKKVRLYSVKNPGRGRAIREYWKISDAEIVSYMDVDLAVNLKHVPELIDPILKGFADFSIGSRLLPTSVIERNIFREAISRTCNVLYRSMFYDNVSDTQCGFKAARKKDFDRISEYFFDNKWFFDTELITYMKHFGYRLKEVPVEWSENRFDKRGSKVKIFADSYRHFRNFLKLRKNMKKLKRLT